MVLGVHPDLGRSFECVAIDAPALARQGPDPSAFAEHLAAPVNTFRSLAAMPC